MGHSSGNWLSLPPRNSIFWRVFPIASFCMAAIVIGHYFLFDPDRNLAVFSLPWRIILSGLLVFLLSLGIFTFLHRRFIGDPVTQLVNQMQEVEKGNLDVRLPEEGTTEFAYLNRGFNRMIGELGGFYREMEGTIAERTEELQMAQRQVLHQEKMATIGLMAAGVAHEIANPLQAVYAVVQMLGNEVEGDGSKEKLGLIKQEIDRMARIVREMSELSRPPSMEKKNQNVMDIVRAAARVAQYDRRLKNVKISMDQHTPIPMVSMVADQMLQVCLNLIVNAADAMEGDGSLTIQGFCEKEEIFIEFEDTGHGIASEFISEIFEPFFTTKSADRGTGLGLSVSKSILEEMGGRLEASSSSGQGAKFTVVLPVEPAES